VYAVFDGHAGKAAAIYSRQHFVRFLLPELDQLELGPETADPVSAAAVDKVCRGC
jgi:serine/threonine protein phosphatase PrpC